MTTTLAPTNEAVKYPNLPKAVIADLLNWDRFSNSYREGDVDRVALQHDIVQVFLVSGGMIPIATWQVDQFLEERGFLVDPIEVVWAIQENLRQRPGCHQEEF